MILNCVWRVSTIKRGEVANRRPDMLMLATMELHGILPRPVVDSILKLYEHPQPVNYDTALESVRERIFEVIASGALEGSEGMPEPSRLPVSAEGRAMMPDDDEHDEEFCSDCEYARRHPPQFWIDAYLGWQMLHEDED